MNETETMTESELIEFTEDAADLMARLLEAGKVSARNTDDFMTACWNFQLFKVQNENGQGVIRLINDNTPPVAGMTRTTIRGNCRKCSGTGYVGYRRDGGVCYRCGGSGHTA